MNGETKKLSEEQAQALDESGNGELDEEALEKVAGGGARKIVLESIGADVRLYGLQSARGGIL